MAYNLYFAYNLLCFDYNFSAWNNILRLTICLCLELFNLEWHTDIVLQTWTYVFSQYVEFHFRSFHFVIVSVSGFASVLPRLVKFCAKLWDVNHVMWVFTDHPDPTIMLALCAEISGRSKCLTQFWLSSMGETSSRQSALPCPKSSTNWWSALWCFLHLSETFWIANIFIFVYM